MVLELQDFKGFLRDIHCLPVFLYMDKVRTLTLQSISRWIYLEPIFGIGTLKSEMAAFQRIDKDFRYIMREISNDLRILSITKISNLSTIIESLENQLSKCQSTLTSFILVIHSTNLPTS